MLRLQKDEEERGRRSRNSRVWCDRKKLKGIVMCGVIERGGSREE